MPALARPAPIHTVTLPARQGRVGGDCDVLIVGGGPAGLGAAMGATGAGAKVILAERYGFLGGNATAALVMPLTSFHTHHHHRPTPRSQRLLPADHGPGEPLVAGALAQFLERLIAAGGAIAPSLDTGYTVPFDPEIFKLVAMQMLDDARVQFLFHAFASGVTQSDDGVDGVVFETKSGPVVIRARAIVDCTGDGDIAAHAGAPFEIGRAEDALTQPMTLMFRMAEFEPLAFGRYVEDHPDQWRGVHGLWDLIRQARAAKELDLPREDMLFFATPHPHEVSVNSTRVTRVSGVDVWDLSYAEWVSRRQMRQIADFLRRYVPGFEHAYVIQSGVNIGVRETRRILGEYQLTAEDILAARKFDDVIARSAYPIDIHNPKGRGTLLQRVPPGDAYDIPLRCLLPKAIDNILTAGRCISGTHEAQSSYRVMPVAMATGQAAGVGAALAVRAGASPGAIAAGSVQRELIRQGANLGGR
jgi:hypothetical protein